MFGGGISMIFLRTTGNEVWAPVAVSTVITTGSPDMLFSREVADKNKHKTRRRRCPVEKHELSHSCFFLLFTFQRLAKTKSAAKHPQLVALLTHFDRMLRSGRSRRSGQAVPSSAAARFHEYLSSPGRKWAGQDDISEWRAPRRNQVEADWLTRLLCFPHIKVR